MKEFLKWIGLKEKIHFHKGKPPHVNEGDLWWISIGENVGTEINGKSNLFSRPVIIFKKLSREMYFVVPTTSKHREGSWYVTISHKNVVSVACLHQARSIDFRRLSSKIGSLDEKCFLDVRSGFTRLYVKNSPPSLAGPREIPNV